MCAPSFGQSAGARRAQSAGAAGDQTCAGLDFHECPEIHVTDCKRLSTDDGDSNYAARFATMFRRCSSNLETTSATFWPPKPKLLLSTWRQAVSRATLGT